MGHYITFDGISTADFGIEVSGEGAFDSPGRVYEMVEIPGRNGSLAIDQGRYENIAVSYPAYNYREDLEGFAKNLADLRAAFGSRVGYRRLADTFNPDEYRLGIFKDGLTVSPVKYNTAAEFALEFDCKPQRFLVSGDEPVDVSGTRRHEVNGNPITFEKDANTIVHSFTGYIFPVPFNQVTPTPSSPVHVTPLDVVTMDVNGTEYAMDFPATSEGAGKYISAQVDLTSGQVTGGAVKYEITGDEEITVSQLQGHPVFVITLDDLPPFDPALTLTKCTRFVRTNLYTVGNLECLLLDGKLWVRYDELGGNLDYFRAMLHNWALTEPLALYGTLTAYTADLAIEPTLPNGTDTVTLTHAEAGFPDPDMGLDITAVVLLQNPTPFDAYPIVTVTGNGTVTIGETTLTVAGNVGPVTIDCQLMEAYYDNGTQVVDKNAYVTMSNHKFPYLPGGQASEVASTGFSSVIVTPRWWRL